MLILKAGASYFAAVFGAGVVLGTVRTLWVVPLVGAKIAELIEAPVMLGVIVVAARWIIRYFSLGRHPAPQLGAGLLGLSFLIVAEAAGILRVRHMSIGEYVASRDPVAGTVYLSMLGVFAVMPLLVGRT